MKKQTTFNPKLISVDGTPRFLSRLFPSKEIIESQEGRNCIMTKTVVVVGSQGTGKTEFFRSMVAEANRRYKKENVNAIMSDGNPKKLLAVGFTKQLVQLICVDDASLALDTRNKEGRKQARMFFQIRKHAKRTGKIEKGLIIVFINTHRYYNIPTEFRSEVFSVVFKSLPTNPYDKRMAERYVGGSGIDDLRSISRLKEITLKANRHSIYYLYDGETARMELDIANNVDNIKEQMDSFDLELDEIYGFYGVNLNTPFDDEVDLPTSISHTNTLDIEIEIEPDEDT